MAGYRIHNPDIGINGYKSRTAKSKLYRGYFDMKQKSCSVCGKNLPEGSKNVCESCLKFIRNMQKRDHTSADA